MQAIVETIFDCVYLITVVTVGITMIIKCKKNAQYKLFGFMAIILGLGDSFHLVPRCIALCTTGLDNYALSLGIGKLITSITMTVFYVLLYHVWLLRYREQKTKYLTISIYALAQIRLLLCIMPQNNWLTNNSPLSWGIYRNIPFALIGLIVIILFYKSAKNNNDKNFKWLYLTIILSFGFYIPVVLFAKTIPMIGMLMIPKTCAYVWTVMIGYVAMRKELKNEEQ